MDLKRFSLPVMVVGVVASAIYIESLTAPKPPPGPVHISYWEKWTGKEYEAIRAVVDDFNASQNKIHVDLLSMSQIDAKTLMAVSAGIPPDVAGLYGANVAQYADDKAIEPLDDLCAKSGISRKDYIGAYWDCGMYDGHIYALPTTPASLALHYNMDMMAKAGFDPNKPPKTIEEMDDMADKMTIMEDGNIKQIGFVPGQPGWWNWLWPYFFGGQVWDGKTKITCNSPECIRAFKWIARFPEKYGTAQFQSFRQGFGNFNSPQEPFLNGKDGMEIQGVWMANFIQTYKSKMRWGAAPFPYPADRPDLARTTLVDMDIVVIPRGCRHRQEAWTFIKYLESQPAMEKLCLLQKKNSPLIHVSDHFWKVHQNPYIHLFYDLAKSPNAVGTPKLGIWPQLSSEIQAAFDSVSLRTKTPEQALNDVVTRMQPIFDEYRERHEMRKRLGL